MGRGGGYREIPAVFILVTVIFYYPQHSATLCQFKTCKNKACSKIHTLLDLPSPSLDLEGYSIPSINQISNKMNDYKKLLAHKSKIQNRNMF
uniref:Uncharacterized protein n=1 Tax=Pyxicephalus adspersus TaxID=30357 RepID=A0AAV3APW0_PYXAD|nr:TPA: hypothetical protein GDO54_007012 [Pyxicephalus adspersus]